MPEGDHNGVGTGGVVQEEVRLWHGSLPGAKQVWLIPTEILRVYIQGSPSIY